MPTYGDLKSLIATDLTRSNLTSYIAQAILDAIDDHSGERFWFNETTDYTFTTTPAVDTYTLASQAPIYEYIKMDRVKTQIGNTWYDIDYLDWNTLDRMFMSPTSGQPMRWTYRGTNQFRIYPTPPASTGAFPIKIFGHYRLMPLVNDSDSNDWTNRARNLIRYTALKRLYTYPVRDEGQQQKADMAGAIELNYLRRETTRRLRRGYMVAYYG